MAQNIAKLFGGGQQTDQSNKGFGLYCPNYSTTPIGDKIFIGNNCEYETANEYLGIVTRG